MSKRKLLDILGRETKTRKEGLDNFDKNGKIYYFFDDFNG